MRDNALTIIAHIESVEDEQQLTLLEQSLAIVLQSPYPEEGMEALFQVFERFPEADGYGLFWSILHGLEKYPNYQTRLITSVRLQPMQFNLLMVKRLLNSGVAHSNGTDLRTLLREIADTPHYTQYAREQAKQFLH